MNKSSFFIAGQHAVIEALRNPKRKVLRVFLTEDAKKNIHRNFEDLMLFEIGPVFKGSKPGEQSTMIGAIKNLKEAKPNIVKYMRNLSNISLLNVF